MTKILKSPFDLVAEALEVTPESINENSSMGEHPNWDSLNFIKIVTAIEKNYQISIPNEEIMRYDNMKGIIELYERLSKEQPS